MIEAIHGSVVSIGANHIIISTGSIDLACQVSTTSSSYFGSLQSIDRDDVTVFTHLHHKEDVMELFGFSTKEERSMFFELIKVQGIGPKQALKILSGITVEALATALDQGDLDRLVKIPGLGTKTAQKLVLALRNKLQLFMPETVERSAGEKLPDTCEEIIHALIDMGYDRKQARSVVKENYHALSSQIQDEKRLEEQLFKASIIQLA